GGVGRGSGGGRGGVGGRGVLRAAVRADAAVDDVGDLDGEAVMLVRDEAGRLPDGARDVLETAAATTDQVVVVVVPVQLVLHAASADGDAPQQIGIGEGVQHVVDRLAGHGPQAL